MQAGSTALAFILLAVASAARAQDVAPAKGFSVEGSVSAVSDYRTRGYSMSGGDPALQASGFVSHASGLYAGGYFSTIKAYGAGPGSDGADLEASLAVGWAGVWQGFDWDAGVQANRYPGGVDVNYVELPVQVSQTIGPLEWSLGAVWAPPQKVMGDEDNLYLWAGVDYTPHAWPIGLTAGLGYEDGAYAPGGKTDWRLGVTKPIGPVTARLEWIDSDRYDSAVVVSLVANF